ncbi:protein kinase [Streptomyces sp. NPDC046909]|uniref:serine/threonine-protein kinase n=1 Tax=Streptomyces sp. NPDC046909 TaxID=3155617 RepID=UPI0034097E0E
MSNDRGGSSPKGRLIGGRYRLAERIGSGGMGTVWRAHDELVDREVAVKQPRLPGDPDDEAHQRASHRLYREARAAARVDHPAAVTIHDVVVEDGLPWIVMELIRGESLHEALRRGPVDPAETARIGLAVLGALRAAHAVGIVHRDVKPANVLLGPHGRVVLTDFGIAHVQGEESLTVSGEFVGSIDFVAPERMSGRGAGPSSDLWSLGVLLYAAVEGEPPFRRTTLESTLAAILSFDPPEPKRAGALAPLIAGLLGKDPDLRPDAEEAARVLEAAAEGWPVPPLAQAPVAVQEADRIRELGEDSGTVRVRGRKSATPEPVTPEPAPAAPVVPDPESESDSALDEDSAPEPRSAVTVVTTAKPKPRLLRRPLPAVLLGAALVAGGGWAGVSYVLAEPEPAGVAEHTATYESAPASEATDEAWTQHRETDMNAVLALPSRYEEIAREGTGAVDRPRLVVYEDGVVQLRLTEWDQAPAAPMTRAKEEAGEWAEYGGGAAATQYTDTSLDGHEAVLADTTYGAKDSPTRVMQLFVRTDDDRMYELRVDMPKGTADEKDGTSLFKGARDRLVIGNG